MDSKAAPESVAPEVLPPAVQAKVIAVFSGLSLITLVLGLIGWYSLHKITSQASLNSQVDLPLLSSIKQSQGALSAARAALEGAVATQNGSMAFSEVAKNEAAFRQAQIKFDAIAAAMIWGTNSEAFARSDGGIDYYEWHKLGLQPDINFSTHGGAQGQLAGQAGIYFAGFTKNASKAIAARKNFLRLSDAGKSREARLAEQQSKELLARSQSFASVVDAKLLHIEKVSMDDAISGSSYINYFAGYSKYGLLLLTVVVATSLLMAGFLFLRYFIMRPTQKIIHSVNKFSAGHLNERIEVGHVGAVMGIIAQSFNSLSANIQKHYEQLESQVKTMTGELEKQRRSANINQRAMMNLLDDAKDLEEQLKVEKAGIEKKVIARTKELKDEHAKLEASINSLSVGFIMTDNQYNIIMLNPQAKKILFAQEGQSQSFKRLSFGDIEKRLKNVFNMRAQIDKCLKTRRSTEEKDLLLDNRFLHIYLAPIAEPGAPQAIGAVILLEDITEERVLQRSRDEFFSIASHELRTPLTAIKGNTSMIQEYYGEQLKDDSLREMVADIHDSSNRLIEIVNDFLDVSRLEQGKVTFEYESFNIAETIESVVYEIGQVAKAKGIYIKMAGNLDTYPKVYADKNRTKQIVYNLVGNAMKFTDKGGISLSPVVEKGFLKILVKDTGRGIPQDKQSLLFHKFQQAGSSLLTRDTTRGTGLGLYISKLLGEKMGGKINLETSEPGKGTTFSFTLPLATSKQISASSPAKKSVSGA